MSDDLTVTTLAIPADDSAIHVTADDPVEITVTASTETVTATATVKVRRKRTPKPPPEPPAPLTWSAAATIAKQGGAEALTAIRAAFARLNRPLSSPATPVLASNTAQDSTRTQSLEHISGCQGITRRDLAVAGEELPAPDALAAAGELANLLGLGVNVKSTPAVIALLDELGLPKVYRRGERGDPGARTKDADVLLDLYLRTGHPVTVALLKTIALRTQLQELDRQLDADGRIRCSFISCGTTTDRTTSKVWLTGAGGNLQTVPSKPVNFRKAYVPDL